MEDGKAGEEKGERVDQIGEGRFKTEQNYENEGNESKTVGDLIQWGQTTGKVGAISTNLDILMRLYSGSSSFKIHTRSCF